jgi:protein-disulfide isomerase
VVPLLEQVLNKNKETVKIVFKNLPLQNHAMARPAALAALAANEQGKFWEFHDMLFAQKNITPDSIVNIAERLGLDMEKFKNDGTSFKILSHLAKDMEEAKNLGVTGTPTIYINGRKLRERSPQGFQSLIDEELRKLNYKSN